MGIVDGAISSTLTFCNFKGYCKSSNMTPQGLEDLQAIISIGGGRDSLRLGLCRDDQRSSLMFVPKASTDL